MFLDYINGISSIIFVVISISVGLKIISKYFQLGDSIFLYVGLTWILMSEIWWASSLSFFIALFNAVGLPEGIYFIIANILVPIAIVIWLKAFTELVLKDLQKWIIIIYVIIGIIWEFFFISLFMKDISLIGSLYSPVNADYEPYVTFYLIFILMTFLVTGIFFSRSSIASTSPEIRLKGKFLLIAIISFTLGAAMDGLKFYFPEPLWGIILIVNRTILALSGFEFYLGFILPPGIRKIFIK